jgi:hypothetical protein
MDDKLRTAIRDAHQREVAARAVERPPSTVGEGDIVVVSPDEVAVEEGDWFTPTMSALWYVRRVHDEWFAGNLIHPYVEFATEADWITDVLPYRCVVGGELYGTVGRDQIIRVLANAGPRHDHLLDLEGHDEFGNGFMPLGGALDPRREFKRHELRRHNNYVLATRARLLAEFPP